MELRQAFGCGSIPAFVLGAAALALAPPAGAAEPLAVLRVTIQLERPTGPSGTCRIDATGFTVCAAALLPPPAVVAPPATQPPSAPPPSVPAAPAEGPTMVATAAVPFSTVPGTVVAGPSAPPLLGYPLQLDGDGLRLDANLGAGTAAPAGSRAPIAWTPAAWRLSWQVVRMGPLEFIEQIVSW